uniref:Uncharacterized protein n=1 Tax=Oryza punctata TaxID=4537 RepID=A0A0E0KRE7_ORYPU
MPRYHLMSSSSATGPQPLEASNLHCSIGDQRDGGGEPATGGRGSDGARGVAAAAASRRRRAATRARRGCPARPRARPAPRRSSGHVVSHEVRAVPEDERLGGVQRQLRQAEERAGDLAPAEAVHLRDAQLGAEEGQDLVLRVERRHGADVADALPSDHARLGVRLGRVASEALHGQLLQPHRQTSQYQSSLIRHAQADTSYLTYPSFHSANRTGDHALREQRRWTRRRGQQLRECGKGFLFMCIGLRQKQFRLMLF